MSDLDKPAQLGAMREMTPLEKITFDIESKLSSHKLDEEGVARLNTVRCACEVAAKKIAEVVKDPRAMALVLTNLQQVMFHANAGISSEFPVVPNKH